MVAASSLFGSGFTFSDHRGERLPWPWPGPLDVGVSDASAAFATINPSAVLRAGRQQEATCRGLIEDLPLVAAAG